MHLFIDRVNKRLGKGPVKLLLSLLTTIFSKIYELNAFSCSLTFQCYLSFFLDWIKILVEIYDLFSNSYWIFKKNSLSFLFFSLLQRLIKKVNIYKVILFLLNFSIKFLSLGLVRFLMFTDSYAILFFIDLEGKNFIILLFI